MIPASEWKKLKKNLVEECPTFSMSGKFAADGLPGYCDGDYPPWLQKEMVRVLPSEILSEFGDRQDSVLNGWFWEIPASAEQAVVNALAGHGYAVAKRMDWDFY